MSESVFWPATAVPAGAGRPRLRGDQREGALCGLKMTQFKFGKGAWKAQRPLAWEPGVVCVKGGVKGAQARCGGGVAALEVWGSGMGANRGTAWIPRSAPPPPPRPLCPRK